jgi:hypothetical protein
MLELPPAAHLARSLSWKPMRQTIRAPRSLSGATQRANMNGGTFLWMATFSEATLRTNRDHRQISALEAILDGGVTRIIVPRCDPRLIPWPVVNGKPVTSIPTVPHDDGTYWSDGTGYAGSAIVASLAQPAAAGATQVTLQIDRAGPFMAGEPFSIKHPVQSWRLYTIAQIVSADAGVVEGSAAGEMVVKIRGPLWEAVSAGTAAEFDHPRCTMVLRDVEDFSLTVEGWKWGQAGFVFLEAPVAN